MLPNGLKGKLLVRFSPENDYGESVFYCTDGTEVKSVKAGKYWETNGEFNSEFGFRFKIENISAPHLMVFAYPDDKRRYMAVSDCMSYDLNMGVSTGGAYPLSNEIKTESVIFWPRMAEENVSFVTMNEGDPAALAYLEIYELENLPEAEINAPEGFRKTGFQFEDPCGCSVSLGAKTFDEWHNRVIQYMKFTGQNELYYPVNWYHGPWWPSETQPSDCFACCLTEDRKKYGIVSASPSDWVEEIMTAFDENGFEFTPTFTLIRLGTLMENRSMDKQKIYDGEDTYLNMRGDNEMQVSVNDWTLAYNARHFKRLLEEAVQNDHVLNFWYKDLAYGERINFFGCGPMFNPLHPVVQSAVKEYICEFARRYKKHKSFNRISINVWHSSMLWYANLFFGYDDYSVSLYEKERGLDFGFAKNDCGRFKKRYELLTGEKYKEDWIEWRCEKITLFIKEISEAIRQVRQDLKFALNFWNEMTKGVLIGGPNPNTQLYSRPSDYVFLREAGMDLNKLGCIEGVEICVENNHQRDITVGFTKNGNKPGIEAGFMFRDFDFLDDARIAAVKKADNPTAFIFNCWEESWGKVRDYIDIDTENIPYYVKDEKRGKDLVVYESTSDKHTPKFWYDWQIVIVSAFPPAPYYMEYYAHSLADFDALNITSGGLYLDTAHSEELLNFTKEYRRLPSVKFNDTGYEDPVTVRYAVYKGKKYIYVVNKSPVKATAEIAFDKISEVLRPGVNAVLHVKNVVSALDPFELRVYVTQQNAEIQDINIRVSDTKAALLEELAAKAIGDLKNNEGLVKGVSETLEKLTVALKEKKYALIYHILTGFVVNKVKEKENAYNRSDYLHCKG